MKSVVSLLFCLRLHVVLLTCLVVYGVLLALVVVVWCFACACGCCMVFCLRLWLLYGVLLALTAVPVNNSPLCKLNSPT
jgi:hypothetical protein